MKRWPARWKMFQFHQELPSATCQQVQQVDLQKPNYKPNRLQINIKSYDDHVSNVQSSLIMWYLIVIMIMSWHWRSPSPSHCFFLVPWAEPWVSASQCLGFVLGLRSGACALRGRSLATQAANLEGTALQWWAVVCQPQSFCCIFRSVVSVITQTQAGGWRLVSEVSKILAFRIWDFVRSSDNSVYRPWHPWHAWWMVFIIPFSVLQGFLAFLDIMIKALTLTDTDRHSHR